MVDKNTNRILLIAGLVLLFIGWLSVFTGFAGFILAEDFEFFIEIEDMLLLKQVITEESIQFQMGIRIIFGFLFIFLGNQFLLSSNLVRERFCRPCMNDVRNLKK